MKRLKLAVMALFTFALTSNVTAQDADNPWGVGFGINTVDNRTWTNDFGTNLEDFVGTTEWGDNTIPSISRITVGKYLDKGFSLEFDGSLNKVKTRQMRNDADQLYYKLGLVAKYSLTNAFGDMAWFDPYVGLGGAYQNVGDEGDGVASGIAGANFWFNDNLGLNLQTGYHHGFNNEGRDFFQHALGLVFKFGGKDTDGDGVYDKYDACPEVPGLKEFKGCPDTDGDGIQDSEDACPEVPGLAEFNGCPDTDGDGVPDNKDACPKTPGLKKFNGCPDTDGDGVPDNLDKCPKVAGPAANKGCPWPDTDGDGVPDNVDKCPKVKGPASNNGCPVVKAEPVVVIKADDQAKMDEFARAIYFNSSKSSFKPGVTGKLDLIAEIMKRYPNANFNIEGHTDSQGNNAYNQRLSERRAKAVLDYLVGRAGISSSRLSSIGFGEDYPIATNKTRSGRAQNRRVEIKLRK